MGDTLIIDPIEIPAVPTVAEGTGAANLLTYDPREVWRGADLPSVKRFHIDLLSDQQFDCVYLGNTNADANSSWTLGIGTQAQGAVVTLPFQTAPMQLPVAGRRQPRGPSLYISPVTLTARYLYIDVYKPAGDIIELGNMILGKAFRPAFNRERGAQRTPFDSGIRTRLGDGSLSTVAGGLINGFKWVFGDLSDAEVDTLWDIVRRRRTTEPVILVEDDNPLVVERVHYGTLIDLEGYLREDPTKNRWALTVEDWL